MPCQPLHCVSPISFLRVVSERLTERTNVGIPVPVWTVGTAEERASDVQSTAQVALVWQQPFHVGTILFLLNRYPPFIDTFMSLFR